MALDKLPNKTYPALGLSLLDRSIKEYYSNRCSKDELQEIREYFLQNGGLSCIYCGSHDATRWDHLTPVSQGGDTVKGNLVPACSSCDDSKQDRSVEEWLDSGSKKAPGDVFRDKIIQKVSRYRSQFSYEPPVSFVSKLAAEELVIYRRFQTRINELRASLIADGIISK